MKILIATRGPKNGRCNICGNVGLLTEDHTPPKGCKKPGQVNLLHISERLSLNKEKPKGRISQNGIKYRTLCVSCNSQILGVENDPDFIAYVNTIGNYLKSTLHFPRTMSVRAKPQRLMRCLLGHMCAQGVDRYEKGDKTIPIRDYMLDESLPLPESLKIYNWVFPYKGHAMARDCALADYTIGDPVAIWFLKFFPLAFLITFNEPESYSFDFEELSQWRNEDIDFETDINVILSPTVPEYWPEAPSKKSVVMYGQEAVTSFDWKKR